MIVLPADSTQAMTGERPAAGAPTGGRGGGGGGDITPPRKLVDVRPLYPADAIAANVEGIVILEATISQDGTVRDARVLRGAPSLSDAALIAVTQWQFSPTLQNRRPVDVLMTVTVNFADSDPPDSLG